MQRSSEPLGLPSGGLVVKAVHLVSIGAQALLLAFGCSEVDPGLGAPPPTPGEEPVAGAVATPVDVSGLSELELEELALDTAKAEGEGDPKTSFSTYTAPYQGNPVRAMRSASTHVCVLTSFNATAEGELDRRVYVSNGTWFLRQADSAILAYARCYAHGDFRTDNTGCGGGTVCFGASSTNDTLVGAYRVPAACGCNFEDAKSMAAGDGAAIVNGVLGRFGVQEPYVRVIQSQSMSSKSYLEQWRPFDVMTSYATAFTPDPNHVVRLSAQYTVHVDGSDHEMIRLRNADSYMCYFTDLGGDMREGGRASLVLDTYNDELYWHLSVWSSSTGDMHASARCVALNQI